MRGSSHLTKEMDVYSYAICCVEILSWGNLPWAYTDDFTIRRLVLGINHSLNHVTPRYSTTLPIDEDERPPLPATSKYATPATQDLVHNCWDQNPAKRPTFSQIVQWVKGIRKTTLEFIDDFSSPHIAELAEPEGEFHGRPSPDMRPIQLPNEDPSCECIYFRYPLPAQLIDLRC